MCESLVIRTTRQTVNFKNRYYATSNRFMTESSDILQDKQS